MAWHGKESWKVGSLLVIALGGILGLFIGQGLLPNPLMALAFGLVLWGGLGIARPRQPQALWYAPHNLATYLLKWVSAVQVEAAILLWFGVALLVQPAPSSAVLLVAAPVIRIGTGVLFLFLGWLLVIRLPGPLEFTLLTSTRLCLTVLIMVDSLHHGVGLVTVGAYMGSMVYGILAMVLHWALRDIARQVADLRQMVSDLQA